MGRSHLQLLARISHALHDKRFKAVVTRGATADEILAEARRVDAALAARDAEAARTAP